MHSLVVFYKTIFPTVGNLWKLLISKKNMLIHIFIVLMIGQMKFKKLDGNHKQLWFRKNKDKGLRVKLAVENGKTVGMIQYISVEKSIIDGKDS